MDHRQNDPSHGRNERHRAESDRNQRPQQSGRDFYPGNYGFEGSQYGGRPESEDGAQREPQGDYRGQVQRGGSFFGGNQSERPGERQGFFKRIFKRGPKGYQRSDERLREDISERLMYAMHIDSSEVTVAVAGGKVTLEGTVPERYMKHAIEDLADECPGVQDIDNRVRVRVQRQREDFPQDGVSGAAQDRPITGAGTSGSRKSGS